MQTAEGLKTHDRGTQEKEPVHSTIDLHVAPTYSLGGRKDSTRKANSGSEKGGKGSKTTREQILAATEYSHFQNVTLAKELADSRTISLDRNEMYHEDQDSKTAQEKDSHSRMEKSSARQTILSRHDQKNGETDKSQREIEEQASSTKMANGDIKPQPSIDKKSYVNCEIIG